MGVQGITETDIANFLAASPGFFERHAELLGSIQLTSPHGQRAVSLQERQMEMLRDKIKGLERQIVDMIRHGQDNLRLSDKLHRWTRALMLTANAADLPDVLVSELQHQFQIPQAAIRVWGGAEVFASLPFARAIGDDVKSFASSLATPYCGVNTGFEAVQWLDAPGQALSLALIPLHHESQSGAFGLLVLASPDPTRYTADMGTEFLTRIGEVASAALTRLLPAP
ncbi:MAG: DUF484 family protein [Pseudomonadota bacterium]|nr:DUF484 family protein [Pseudomonadota bacterium]